MSSAFISGVKKYLPNAKITFDKFHVLKIINEAVDKVSRIEVKEQPILKELSYLFLKNDHNFSQKQKSQKVEVAELELKIWHVMLIRKLFQGIYKDVEESQRELIKEMVFLGNA